jgi:seryl-tRNA synthetase
MIALLENFQDEGGSIAVPQALWDFGAPHRLGRERAPV